MSKEKSIQRLQKFVEKFLQKADFSDCRVETVVKKDEIVINIFSEKSANLLIGQNGENLRAIQYLIRLLVHKNLEEESTLPFLVDINGYRQQKDRALFDLAEEAALQAKQDSKPIILRIMNAYERRLVHLHLSERTDIKTESIGEGEERKVVVRPVSFIE
ncbi:MAG: KH domain-containing protein [Candidatus Moranbacteria bacterium]|nr:KH domain-containing protein [Candidatus Moranbacteria bacterium]